MVGAGTYGQVISAFNKVTQNKVAIKKLSHIEDVVSASKLCHMLSIDRRETSFTRDHNHEEPDAREHPRASRCRIRTANRWHHRRHIPRKRADRNRLKQSHPFEATTADWTCPVFHLLDSQSFQVPSFRKGNPSRLETFKHPSEWRLWSEDMVSKLHCLTFALVTLDWAGLWVSRRKKTWRST